MISPEKTSYILKYERNGQVKEAVIDKHYRKIIGVTSTLVNGETTTTVSPTDMTSPAYKAGIMDGDVVVKINDIPVNTWNELTNQIENSSKTVKVTVDRDGDLLDFNIDPVSYTHLDVYKRQIWECWEQ